MLPRPNAPASAARSNIAIVLWLLLLAAVRGLIEKLRWLSLKPHGTRLCTPGADFWIVCARIAILTMALAEALSWGYLGRYIGANSELAWLAAVITGLAFATLIWVLDATFITLDWERSFYEEHLRGKDEASSNGDKPKLLLGVIMRVGMVFVTLAVSAPFLSQIVFSTDIAAAISSHNAALIAQARQRILEPLTARLNQLHATLDQTQRLRIEESQGVTKSGRYGNGPAVKTIERRIADLEREIHTTQAALEQQARQFDSTSPDVLAKQYNIAILGNGLEARGQALNRLTENQQYTKADIAIKAFLGLLFAGLVLLKIFQPRSIRIYYSEQLQDVYEQFLAGRFNPYLESVERPEPEGRGMKPLRFEDWAMNVYPVIREEDEKNKRNGAFERQHREDLLRLTALRTQVHADIGPLRDQIREAGERIDHLDQKMAGTSAEFNTLGVQLEIRRHSRSVLQETLRSLEGESVAQALNEIVRLEGLIVAGESRRTELTASRDAVARQLEAARHELRTLESALDVRLATFSRVEAEIQAAHTDFAKNIRRPKSPLTEMPPRPEQRTREDDAA